MSFENIVLLSNYTTESTDSSFSYSERGKGAGYHNLKDNLHTAIYELNEFAGTVKLQATLELYPTEDDWFDIVDTEIGGDNSVFSTTQSVTFSGNFVWIRAAYNLQNGTITSIYYNL